MVFGDKHNVNSDAGKAGGYSSLGRVYSSLEKQRVGYFPSRSASEMSRRAKYPACYFPQDEYTLLQDEYTLPQDEYSPVLPWIGIDIVFIWLHLELQRCAADLSGNIKLFSYGMKLSYLYIRAE